MLNNVEKKWQLTMPETGEILEFKKQDDLKKKIFDDPEFGHGLRASLIDAMMNSHEVIE